MIRRSRIVAAGLLLLVFVIGGLSGMAIEEATGIDWFEFLDEDRDRSGEDLLEGLGLTDTQEDQAERLLDAQEDSLEAYWEQRLPEINLIIASSYARIRVLLTPEQQAVFDDRIRKLPRELPGVTPDR
jgi:Spy/CpxP family protein refolding chaperone